MGLYYLDTSALVKLYVREAGTERMIQLASRSSGHKIALLGLTRVEFRSALRRRERAGDLGPDEAADAIARMEGHLQSLYLVQPVSEAVIEEAGALVDRHNLRAYDALQLAGCLSIRSRRVPDGPTFVCSDRELLDAAGREGLPVLDPGV